MRVGFKNHALWVLLPLLTMLALAVCPLVSWADEAVDTAGESVAEELDGTVPAEVETPSASEPVEQPAVEEPAVPTEEPAAPAQNPSPAADNPVPDEPASAPETPETPANSESSGEPVDAEPVVVAEEAESVPETANSEEDADVVQEPEPPASKTVVSAPIAKPAKRSGVSGDVAKDDSAKRSLADGTYLLRWSKDKTYLVQSADASRVAGANVQLGKDTGLNRQRWIVKYLAKYGFYSIVNEYSKKALSVASGKAGAKVLQNVVQTGAKNQLWSIVKAGSGFLLSPKVNAKLAVTGEKTGSGYRLVLRKATDAKTQCFLAKDQGIVRSGIYSLAHVNDSKRAATLPHSNMKDKTKLWWYTYKKNLNQKFNVLYAGKGQYTLQLVHSGKYLGVDGSAVIQASSGKAKAQRWRIVWNKTGIALKNVATGKRLYVPKATVKNKLLLSTGTAKNNAAQRFALTERLLVSNGTYIIHTFSGNRALAVQNGSVAEFGNIDAETTSKGNSQKFSIKYVNGKYRITNLKSNLVVGYTSDKAGANVRQRPKRNTNQQLFKAVVSPAGGIKFIGVYGGKTLDIAGTTTKSGANVHMADSDNSKGQRWWLQRTSIDKTEAVVDRALRMAQAQGSETNWYLAVDVKNHRTMVLKRAGDSWKLVKNWLCSVGAPDMPTVLGSYTVGIKGYSFGEGYTCYYYTQFWGDYLFHSVKYYEGTFNVMDGRLGQDVSEGCVRLPINQAKWIYDNIPEDTSVRTYR